MALELWVTQDKKSPDRGTNSRVYVWVEVLVRQGLADLLGSGRAGNTNGCLGLIFMNLGRGPGHAGPSAMQHQQHLVVRSTSWTISFLLMSTLEDGYAHRWFS